MKELTIKRRSKLRSKDAKKIFAWMDEEWGIDVPEDADLETCSLDGKQAYIMMGKVIGVEEKDDEWKYEMFYFYKFTFDQEDYLKFPEYLIEGKCVEVVSSALKYFLADTLFFDFLISKASSEKSVAEVMRNMTAMRNQWVAARLKYKNLKLTFREP